MKRNPAWQQRYWEANKEKCRAASKLWKNNCVEKRMRVLNHLKELDGCRRCGASDHRVLDLHHRDPAQKEFSVARNTIHQDINRVFAELCKCDVLCKNCHAIVHWEMRNAS